VKEEKKKNQILLQAPKGMRDILPEDAPYWEKINKALDEVADFYDFKKIDTPIVERIEIFIRGVGAGTDIIEKELYLLKSKGAEKLALRPEFTAPVMRAYLEHGMSRLPQPVKMYYLGPAFRYESPQAGRFRQFHHAGFEIVGGETDPVYDAQAINVAVRFLEKLKIKNPILQINTIGCRVCRLIYRKKLQDFYRKQKSAAKEKKIICRDCERRMEINPLRLLDCKNELCARLKEQAPIILDSICANCRSHFKGVLEFLDEIGLPYELNSYLVRGLDYYNRTVFELFAEEGKSSLAGGGRYDYLSELLGKKSVPAVGVAIGLERVIETMKLKEPSLSVRKTRPKVFVVHVGELAKKRAFSLIEKFREANIKLEEALGKDSLQAQLKAADKEAADIVLIIGQKEVYEEMVIVRDMKTGGQENVPLKKIIEEMKKRLS
jgi:histidyl-tRNA synthetase